VSGLLSKPAGEVLQEHAHLFPPALHPIFFSLTTRIYAKEEDDPMWLTAAVDVAIKAIPRTMAESECEIFDWPGLTAANPRTQMVVGWFRCPNAQRESCDPNALASAHPLLPSPVDLPPKEDEQEDDDEQEPETGPGPKRRKTWRRAPKTDKNLDQKGKPRKQPRKRAGDASRPSNFDAKMRLVRCPHCLISKVQYDQQPQSHQHRCAAHGGKQKVGVCANGG
jgi:hypothetical protein